MIVSHEHRFVFVEVPQTGSTAIAKELLGQYGCEEVLHKHAHLREFLNQATPDEKRYIVAVGTRHPLDQLASHHTKLRNNHRGAYEDPERFEENGGWVSHAAREQFQFVRDSEGDFGAFLKRYYIGQQVRVSQYAWGRSRYKHLIRFETLDNDFQAFLRTFGIEPKRELPVTNPTESRKPDFLSAYPEELRGELRAVLGPLIAEWGYDFPEDWGGGTPLSSRVVYAFKNLFGRVATEVLRLTPRHYTRARARFRRPS